MKTYYHILNVSPCASDEDVRKAWRILALRWHPDRNPQNRVQAQANFILINRAYTMLKTQPQREAYNRRLLAQRTPRGNEIAVRKHGVISTLREILWPFALNSEARHG
ncbi:MAG TPA: J domain-containing protein [Alphaproteobacteria bacterium]|jgi:curved DNA-binding protein CbpA